jgi:serine/threonine protein kinase/tetratricopeptide (TPR) repeat protein
MNLRRQSTGEAINQKSLNSLGAGGEARVFVVGTTGLAAKIYHRPTSDHAAKLIAMLANPPVDPMSKLGHVSIAWPCDLLLSNSDNKNVLGYLMPLVSGLHPVIDFYHPKTRRREHPLFNYLYLLRTARNFAAAVGAIHARGYIIGDINESNTLVSETALVTLVDTDSFQVPDRQRGKIHRCPVGKPEFTPPELQNIAFASVDRTPEHDCFGLAVLIFQLLMEGTHPFSGRFTTKGEPPSIQKCITSGYFPYALKPCGFYEPKPGAPPFDILSPELRNLFRNCFEDGHTRPDLRPSAENWQRAFADAEQKLITCKTNTQHQYGEHLVNCPWCERRSYFGGIDPFPSQLAARQGAHLRRTTGIQTPLPLSLTVAPPVQLQSSITSSKYKPAQQIATIVPSTKPVSQPFVIKRLALIAGVLFGVMVLIFIGEELGNPTARAQKTYVPPAPPPANITARQKGQNIRQGNIVFSDDFTGNLIDSTKWTYHGDSVLQKSQIMEVLTTVTDHGGGLTSVPIPINSSGKITITRQVFLHYGNQYFEGQFGINVGSMPQFSVWYANMNYSGSGYKPEYGFFLTRNNARPDVVADAADVNSAFTPLWDTWFNEKVTYDPLTGVMEYFINDVSQGTFNVGVLPQMDSPTMTLTFTAWGWYTGHEQVMRNLIVTQVASPTAASSGSANMDENSATSLSLGHNREVATQANAPSDAKKSDNEQYLLDLSDARNAVAGSPPDYSQALVKINEALKIHPDSVKANQLQKDYQFGLTLNEASALLDKGDLDQATAKVEAALALKPSDEDAIALKQRITDANVRQEQAAAKAEADRQADAQAKEAGVVFAQHISKIVDVVDRTPFSFGGKAYALGTQIWRVHLSPAQAEKDMLSAVKFSTPVWRIESKRQPIPGATEYHLLKKKLFGPHSANLEVQIYQLPDGDVDIRANLVQVIVPDNDPSTRQQMLQIANGYFTKFISDFSHALQANPLGIGSSEGSTPYHYQYRGDTTSQNSQPSQPYYYQQR